MLKTVLVCLLCCLIWRVAYGQESVRVFIYPFEVNSEENLDYLKWEIWDSLASLIEEGGKLFVIEKELVESEIDRMLEDEIDEAFVSGLGARLGADFAIWGSLTKIGEKVSVDGVVLEIGDDGLPIRIYVDGKGLHDLTRIIDEFSRRINLVLLGGDLIVKISIRGNDRIEEDAIRPQIKSKEGDVLSRDVADEDLKRIYRMGYFEDVKVIKEDGPGGKEIIFVVSEKPFIKRIEIDGNNYIRKEDIEESVDIKLSTTLNFNDIERNVKNIIRLYRDKGYWMAEVDYRVYYLKTNEAIVAFRIKEHGKTKIKELEFVGNKVYEDEELLDIMETKEKGFFSWLTDSGVLREDVLDQDTDRIRSFYNSNGYAQVKIGKPQINLEKTGIYVTISVDEGEQFKIGKVDVQGDLLDDKKVLLEGSGTTTGKIFDPRLLREDMARLTDIYARVGYAFVDVTPLTAIDKENQAVHVTFDIQKGEEVYFERITIAGNTRTRDKVIRRELKVMEGELYDKVKLGRSYERVKRLGYFEEVNFNTTKGSGDDKLNLDIRVKERSTGSVSAGIGYSSVDDVVAMFNIGESNLFGRGQNLSLAANIGGRTTNYNLGFTEPWLFDTPISAGFDIYDVKREYTDYDQQADGGAIRLGFPVTEDYTRLFVRYRHESVKISDVWDVFAIIKEEEGTSTTSGIKVSLVRDSRNDRISPTKGSRNSISVEYAGGPLGGTNYFTKYTAETRWYFPLIWDTVFMCRGVVGYTQGNEGRDVPLFERFFLGGINSLRGFEAYSVGPKDPNPHIDDVIGGTQQLLFNIEYIFPLIKEAGVKGVVFFDAGNAFNKKGDYPNVPPYGDIPRFKIPRLRSDVGGGIRWHSPMGPLRLEWGYNLDPEPDEKQSNWEFTIGMTF